MAVSKADDSTYYEDDSARSCCSMVMVLRCGQGSRPYSHTKLFDYPILVVGNRMTEQKKHGVS
jgi:3'-phosphoadenosine 5'-phosphosulfate sulfotransferase (PAPS reductase)/FAD synthetase